MTRSPLKSPKHRHQRNDRPSQRNKNSLNDQRGQRERLAKQVIRRQQEENNESTTIRVEPTSSPSNNNNNNNNTLTTNNMPAVEVPVIASLTPEQMYSNFEEWIKMCTDNKVNANNSWNFALIDYFHEMTFLRDGDSINFQKASCTLDGCVKIYTSRVDSVATETGKLLSGLADSATGDGDDDDDPQRSGDGPERRTRRRGNRAESTLLRDFSSIALKKFDLDFAVDPLFKKTSADFDEGGARGLLLNHLAIDRDCKIIFDASDASGAEPIPDKQQENEKMDHDSTNNENSKEDDANSKEDDANSKEDDANSKEDNESSKEDQEKVTMEEDPMDMDMNTNDTEEEQSKKDLEIDKENQPIEKEKEEESLVEISRLRAKLPPSEIIATLQICPTLHGYSFFSDTDMNMPDLENTADPFENPVEMNQDQTINFPTQDDYAGMDDDYDYGDDGPLLDGINDIPFGDGNEDDQDDDSTGRGRKNDNENQSDDENENPLQETDFMSAMTGGDGSDMFSYFDSTFGKNWAGPEHWKLRRPISKGKKAAQEKDSIHQEENVEGEKSRKRQKQQFQIDFIAGEDIDEELLFATDKRTKISMSSVQETAVKDDTHLLPNDMHFSSKQLLKLFLKPTFSVSINNRMRSRKKQNKNETTPTTTTTTTTLPVDQTNTNEEDDQQYDYDPGMDDYDVGPDTQFWADQPTESPDVQDQTQIDTQNDSSTLAGIKDTSYFQDSYYDAYDDIENSHLYGDVLITNHRLKKTKPLYVNYARTAKRVDVKKLKDNLWKALTITKSDSSVIPVENNLLDTVQGIQRFTDILQELRKMYSVKAMKDISVPFCFICLLHLANERNLTISRPTNTSDPEYDPDDFVLGDEPMDENFLNEVTIVQNL
ncbi:hypothetical protein INT45_013914 [Circinella minor]|uniref:Condensin complex subunit 2 n=1 Tax=Circinella minor TaxID=1195481 RepID=A0A8H7RWU8_9FUNG|nr:hypothetical protein INT45_013914 [Circinella minor]